MAPRKASSNGVDTSWKMPTRKCKMPDGKTAVITGLTAREMRLVVQSSLIPGKSMTDEDAFDNDKLELLTLAMSIRTTRGTQMYDLDHAEEILDLPYNVFQELQIAVNDINKPSGAEGNA